MGVSDRSESPKGAARDPRRRKPSAAPFVGREREMAELLTGLDQSLSGRGRIFLISGEPGIGKSRLAEEVAAEARDRGARVLVGRSWEAGGAPAYWPWVQPFRTYLRKVDPEVFRAQMGSGAEDIAQMLPELRELFPDLPPAASTDPETARFRLFDATASFLKNIADEQPLVLVIDDLHAADTPSLVLLQFIAALIADAAIVIICAYRDTALRSGHPLRTAIAELGRQPVTARLQLTGLGVTEVGRFMEEMIGSSSSPAAVEAIHAQTEGNPLFVNETVRLLAAGGSLSQDEKSVTSRLIVPRGVREAIVRRLSGLSEGCNEILTLASVCGREFDLDVLEHLAGVTRGSLLDLLNEAIDARVITDLPDSLGRQRFSHALVRDALYEELPAPRRVAIHRQVAETLAALHAANSEPHLAEVALHYFRAAPAGEVEAAVAYARRAAERALGLLAYEEAARLFDMGLQALELKKPIDEQTRCKLLLGLGDAHAKAGDEPASKEAFVEAAGIAERIHSPEDLAAAALGYGGRFVWNRAGSDTQVISLLERALDELGDRDSSLRVRLLARLAGASRDQAAREPRQSLSREAVEVARRIADLSALAYALDGRYAALMWPENPDERIKIADELVEVAYGVQDREKVVQGRMYRVIALLELGDITAVKGELDVMDLLAAELRQGPQLWLVTVTRATLALFEGRFDDAEQLIERALTLGERSQRSDAVLSHRIQSFTLRRERGALADMEGIIRRSIDEYPARPMFRCMLAFLYAEEGREDSARRILDELAHDDFAALPRSNEWLFSMGFLADVVGIIGDRPLARAMFEMLLPYARYNQATADYISTGSVSRSLAILATADLRWEEAARHFEDALEANQAMGAAPWIARTLLGYSQMFLRRAGPGDDERATERLTEGIELSRRLGMTPLLELATERLGTLPGRSGAEPTRAGTSRAGPYVFRSEGDYWAISYDKDSFRLKDLKGLHYIARLLGEPGREFHVLDLVVGDRGPDAPSVDSELHHFGLGDAGAMLDPQAKAAYRRRLKELDSEMEEARAAGDHELAARAQTEHDLLVQELSRAVGLGGRDRRASSASERARASVSRAIRNALSRIRTQSPSLGSHFDHSLRLGTFCVYAPDPRTSIDWRL